MVQILLAIAEIESIEERELVRQLFFTYGQRIKALARYILKNDIDAEDALHETFLKIIKYRHKFMQIDQDETQRLIVIYTRSVCFNMCKRKYKMGLVSMYNDEIREDDGTISTEFSTETDPVVALVEKENRDILVARIDALGTPAREILLLKYYEEMQNVVIADMLGLNPSTVGTILQRSLQKLRKCMEEYLHDANA